MIAWREMKRGGTEPEILDFFRPFERWGAYLHRLVNVGDRFRIANKIAFPPF